MVQQLLKSEIELRFEEMQVCDQHFEDAFKNGDYECLEKLLRGKYNEITSVFRRFLQGSVNFAKSDTKSDLVRNGGNNALSKVMDNFERLLIVLYVYDFALSFAVTSERKAKAYSNLSAIYFRMNFIPQTLEAIEYAMKHVDKSDHKLIGKLQERKQRCQGKRSKVSNCVKDPAQLSYPSHATISGLAGVLKFNGKNVITKKALKYGDIIAMTRSSCFFVDALLNRQFCNHCGDRTSVKIPCDFCYCTFGESCKALAMEGFHGMECESIPDFLFCIDKDILKYTALKFAFKAMNMENFANIDEVPKNFTCFDWKHGDEKNDMMILKTILNMKQANLTFKQMFTLVSYYMTLLDRNKHNERFQAFIRKFDNGEKGLFDMFCKSYLVIKRNYFVTDYTTHIDWLHGLFQRSCKPNVLVVHDSKVGTNNYLVLDDIAAGDKLTIAYG